ncbi:MAG TPA: CHAT domain-containing protein [Actinocrinis sp.]|nr:CHAT domain-containing protein [Actinocrinis sp.]
MADADVHDLLVAAAERAGLGRAAADGPMRGALAADAVVTLLHSGLGLTDARRLRPLDGLLEIAQSDPPPDPRWPRIRAMARCASLMLAAAERRLADPTKALAEIDALAAQLGADPLARMIVEPARQAITLFRAIQQGDESAYSSTQGYLEEMRTLAQSAGSPQASAIVDVLGEAIGISAIRHRGGDMLPALDDLHDKVHRLLPGSDLANAMDEVITQVAPMRAMMSDPSGGSWPTATEEQVAAIRDLAARPGIADTDRAVFLDVAAVASLGLGVETDPRRVDEGVQRAREAVAASGPDDPQRAFHLVTLALALIRRNELTNSPADLQDAAVTVREARRLAGGPGNPLWPLLSEMETHVNRRRGESNPHKAALDGLRSLVFSVLLQDDATAARFAARNAARDAIGAARECLADGDPDDAVRALDSGRSLMLFAATEMRDLAPRLEAAGRHDLAQRWRQAGGSGQADRIPGNLRHDVLTALAGQSGLLDSPSPAEIAAALRALDADALVYLVPRDADGPGFAALVPASGPASLMVLLSLEIAADFDMEQCLRTLSDRGPRQNRDLSPQERQDDVVQSVDALSDLAWRAALGPIVEHYLPTLPKPAAERPRRLILVPMGPLALIPWQAARRPDGDYAIKHVAISLAASARMLCRSAAQAPVPPSPVGLVVGDPDTKKQSPELLAARVEAEAIHRAFYRYGRYIGTRADGSPSPSGAGSAQEVRAWLQDTRPGLGSTLHLACHGVIETGRDDPTAYLLLAGGDRITAEEIVSLLSRSGAEPDPERRGDRREIGVAVLAACRTGRSVHGYDEAYSLGTAFLAGGVRSVLSTQWAIPDRATSVLMFMVHHYLMVGRRPAWAALHEAQLWMLDPRREPPPTMPPDLRRQLDQADVARIDAWAGFVHAGQ